ncbi:hypothetical protein [Hyphomicrobium sp.]|uniref:hypothetical protein n=1 Tax=Hyphomicrobium sp. TaxID=82 RepID=UPI002FDEE8D1
MIRTLVVGLAALVIGGGVALAADGEHAHDHSAKHGGIVEHSGHHHLELVAKGDTIKLYVTDESGAPEDASAAQASATVLADGKVEKVALEPAGGNALKGSGGFNAGKGTTVVVSLTLPGHEPEQVRFALD